MTAPLFRVKICGIRQPADVAAAASAGADAVGLNCFPSSIRYLDAAVARQLAREAASAGLLRVGVFVNEPVEGIRRIADEVGLDVIQLHGDESPEVAAALIQEGRGVLRAIRLPRGHVAAAELRGRCAPWEQLGCQLLLDADAGAAFGGSGAPLDWPSLGHWSDAAPHRPWILAGGLRPENVVAAVRAARPWGVDVASGVERPKGAKAPALVQTFTHDARGALAELDAERAA